MINVRPYLKKKLKKKNLYLFIISLTPEGHHKSPLASFFVLFQETQPSAESWASLCLENLV